MCSQERRRKSSPQNTPLNFAMQAVNRALLVSLQAIEAQRLEEKKEAEEQ